MIIEVVGVAGTGKTTLTKHIRDQFPDWETNHRLSKRSLLSTQFAALARNIVPVLRYSEPGRRAGSLRTAIHMEVLSRVLSGPGRDDRTIVFDQGVIYEYAALCNLCMKQAPATYLERFYRLVTEVYFEALDVAVVLHAPMEVVLQRVNAREGDHRLKVLAEPEAERFFEGYEAVYSQLTDVMAKRGIRVIEIDTREADPAAVFEQFREALEL